MRRDELNQYTKDELITMLIQAENLAEERRDRLKRQRMKTTGVIMEKHMLLAELDKAKTIIGQFIGVVAA